MIYFADTANCAEIQDLIKFYPIDGVTTNPSLIAASGKPLSKIIPEILECIGNRMIHIQMISQDAENMLREARYYRNYFGLKDNFYAKIPVTKEGFRAMRLIKESGIKVTATAIFTEQQALMAAKTGADFVAPYVNRLDNIASHGVEVVSDIVEALTIYGYSTKVLAASFKNADQVYRVSLTGCHAVTLSYDILNTILSHPLTDKGVADFTRDGSGYYDLKY
jgi:fructose-6-phosphate aldolase 2